MSLRRFFVFCLLIVGKGFVHANGDPVAVYSAITLSPTPVAVHVPEVQLVDEYVTFVPDGLYTTVTVRYLLHNRSDRSFDSLPYGFPIDYWGSGPSKWVFLDEYSESEMEVGWRDGYIRNVTFMLGDKQLSWQCSSDTIIKKGERFLNLIALIDVIPDSADDYSQHIIDSLYAIYGDEIYSYTKEVSRRWYYTYLTIPAHSFATLEVNYKVLTSRSEGAYHRKYNIMDYFPEYYWHLRFSYDFTPAAYWGDGHADYFSAVVDASNIELIDGMYWLREQNDYSKAISGLPMEQNGDIWHYETSRFDLAAAKPFTIDFKLKHQPHQDLDRLLNSRIDPTKYTIEVSGIDKKYPVGNLTDLKPYTTAVLRPDKNDSTYITIRFKRPTSLEAMLILNGYTKNIDTWRENSRIDSMMITGDGFSTYYYEGDTNTSQDINETFFGRTERGKGEKYWITLPDKFPTLEPKAYDWQTLVDGATLINLTKGGGPWGKQYFTELRINISATAKGLKYDDLCVSEIILIGR